MPTEIRHIIFTQDEVVRAVVEYHKRTANPLPSGAIVKLEFEREPEVRCALHLDLDAGHTRQIFWIENALLAAALIFFCINNRIPLPTRAAKQLQMLNDKVALVVTKQPGSDKGNRAGG